MSSTRSESTVSEVDDSQVEEANRAVILHYHKLCSTLTAIRSKDHSEHGQTAHLSDLHQLQEAADGIGGFLSLHVSAKYYNELRPSNSVIAEETLNIPELLELILMFADHCDIMNMTKVSRNIKAIIHASSKLQTRLYLKAADSSAFKENEFENVFNSNHPGFRVFTNKNHVRALMPAALVPSGVAALVTAQFWKIGGANRLPRIGSTWRAMLICQPPVKHMTVSVECSFHGTSTGYGDEGFIHSETHLTVGDLYKQAERIFADYKSCKPSQVGASYKNDDFRNMMKNLPCPMSVVFESHDPVRDAIDMD